MFLADFRKLKFTKRSQFFFCFLNALDHDLVFKSNERSEDS